MVEPLCHHHVPTADCGICAARRRIKAKIEAQNADSQEVGFKPREICPLCSKEHTVDHMLHQIPLMACPEAKEGSLYFFESGKPVGLITNMAAPLIDKLFKLREEESK